MYSIIALINSRNMPNVNTVIGMVSISSNGFKNVFKNDNTMAKNSDSKKSGLSP
jgi:hypothetical protein